MSLRQSGINPLGYLGVEPVTVSADVAYPRSPTSTDSQNFTLMTRWLNTTDESVWILVSLAGGVATWVELTTGGGGTILTITGDAGGAVGPDGSGNINFTGGLSGGVFTGNPGTHTQELSFNYLALPSTDASGNGIIYFGGTKFISEFGTQNAFFGEGSGNLTLTTASGNIGIGLTALDALTTGDDNVSVGNLSQTDLTTGSNNSSLGYGTLFDLVTGSWNVAVGFNAGLNYTTSESSNILIGNTGIVGESNVIRIGTQGGGNAQQNQAFMAGIYNVTPSGSPIPVVINSNGQLGTGGGAVFSQVATQVFTGAGTYTYTPTAGMQYAILTVVGAGGGGAGAAGPGAGNGSVGMGGGAGGYAQKTVSAATIGASQTVTIGAGGAGGANTGSNGVAGGTSSVGAIVSATGGDFGLGTGAFGIGWIFAAATDGTGGIGINGDVNVQGNAGDIGFGLGASFALGGRGGASYFGGSTKTNSAIGSAAAGLAATSYGAGGGGACCQDTVGGAAGGNGFDGLVVILEFLN